jgi:hypothetical protein
MSWDIVSQFSHLAASNPFLSGGIAVGAVSWAGSYLKSIPEAIG